MSVEAWNPASVRWALEEAARALHPSQEAGYCFPRGIGGKEELKAGE